jgi:hypothetical protein
MDIDINKEILLILEKYNDINNSKFPETFFKDLDMIFLTFYNFDEFWNKLLIFK